MVYNGPSTGCLTCRRRKVKCSGERPLCHNCVKRKVDCPGYGDAFDARHRNQTQSVIKRAGQKSIDTLSLTDASSQCSESTVSSLSPYSRSTSPSTNASSSPFTVLVRASQDGAGFGSPFNFSIPLDLELTAVNFFFNNFGKGLGDAEAVHGFMPHLARIYSAAPLVSPLQAATASISINMLMLFTNQSSDGEPARIMYNKAVSGLKRAILDPCPSSYNDLILVILILDFYEVLNSRFHRDAHRTDAHKLGALALIKHRKSMNYADNNSKAITADVRTTLCNWAIDTGKDLPEDVVEMLRDPALPQTKSDQLDVLTLQLISVTSRSRRLSAESDRWTDDVDIGSWQDLYRDVLQLNDRFQDWFDTLPQDWQPLYVSAQDIEPTIKLAGMYGDRCGVYKDPAVCDVLNTYRVRRITILQVMQQCCSKLQIERPEKSRSSLIQQLVDEACETLPYHMGDVVEDLQPIVPLAISYPYTYKDGAVWPRPEVQHPRQAMASGGWIIYNLLQTILKRTKSTADFMPLKLRPGQVEWIKIQLKRIEIVYTFIPVDESLNDSASVSPEADVPLRYHKRPRKIPEPLNKPSVDMFQQFWNLPKTDWSNKEDSEMTKTTS